MLSHFCYCCRSADQEADEDDELRLPLVDHSASEAQSSAEQAGEANGDAVSEGESDTSSCSSDEQGAGVLSVVAYQKSQASH